MQFVASLWLALACKSLLYWRCNALTSNTILYSAMTYWHYIRLRRLALLCNGIL